jgi:hypothetical protein
LAVYRRQIASYSAIALLKKTPVRKRFSVLEVLKNYEYLAKNKKLEKRFRPRGVRTKLPKTSSGKKQKQTFQNNRRLSQKSLGLCLLRI